MILSVAISSNKCEPCVLFVVVAGMVFLTITCTIIEVAGYLHWWGLYLDNITVYSNNSENSQPYLSDLAGGLYHCEHRDCC